MNNNNGNKGKQSEEQMLWGEESSALQVETHGTIQSTGDLQEQTKPSHSQVADLSENVDDDGQEDDYESTVSNNTVGG